MLFVLQFEVYPRAAIGARRTRASSTLVGYPTRSHAPSHCPAECSFSRGNPVLFARARADFSPPPSHPIFGQISPFEIARAGADS